MGANRKVEIKCTYTEVVPAEDLSDLQGGLKQIGRAELEQLKRAICQAGILFPVPCWRNGGKRWIVDGHQRKKALLALAAEGWEVPGMPVVYVKARDRKEAMRAILLAESRYAKITKRGIAEFIKDIDFDLIRETVNIPEVDAALRAAEPDDRPEVEFTEELQEEHNYVVLFFDTSVDWLNARTILGLEQVRALDAKRGNKGWARMGIGRVLRGPEAIAKIQAAGRRR